MLNKLTAEQIPSFNVACAYEHVFGSKIFTAQRAYGLNRQDAQFFLQTQGETPCAALYLSRGVLVVSATDDCDMAPIAALAKEAKVGEINATADQCETLKTLLGGETEQSYYMVYNGGPIPGNFDDIDKGDLMEVFGVLQASHEYYRTHFQCDTWSAELGEKLEKGLIELYQLSLDGQAVCTGSILSEDDECGVVCAVAVRPEYRHRGLGAHMSTFLTNRILEKGKTPRLNSGYDAVAELYRQVGYVTCGRWGELYL
ncbi:MAG: GNAT family N-acetyltransferase [Oscillospiraceae bacterium]